MKSRSLLSTDLVVRFDRAAKTVSLLTVNAEREEPITHVIHELAWNPESGVVGVTDVGAAVCSYLYAANPGSFCSAETWEEIAEAIRRAAGRDDEK